MKTLRSILLIFFLLATLHLSAQEKQLVTPPQKTRVLLILNCSNSMWDTWQSDAKIKVTQQVLLRFLDSIAEYNDMEVALRVFGHLNKGRYSTKLEVPFADDNSYRLKSKIKTLVPNGGNTVATALTESLNDFPPSDDCRNIIIIITDGIDDSDGDICQVARRVQLSGIIVQTFILGIGNPTDFRHSLDCAGNFTYLPDEAEYTRALYEVFRRSDQRAAVLFNLHDSDGMPLSKSHAIALYDAQTNVVKYTTLSSEYANDTLWVDPLVDYNLVCHSVPALTRNQIHFDATKATTIDLVVDEGTLSIHFDGARTTFPLQQYPVEVRSDGKFIATQQLGGRATYRTGRYDVDILSSPAIHLHDVEIRSGSHTDLSIATPGQLTLTKPKQLLEGSLFRIDEGKMVLVGELNSNLATERMLLQPGEYHIVYRPMDTSTQTETKNYRFTITSAKQTNVGL